MISKDEILEAIVDLYKQSFSQAEIDFDKPNLETNLVLTQAILDENILNYITLLANESTLSTAILPETIYQFASTFGYIPQYAQPASADVDMYIPIESSGQIIPQLKLIIGFDTTFVYNDIVYRPTSKIYVDYIKETNTISIVAYDINGNKFVIPGFIDILKINNVNTKCIRFTTNLIQSDLKIFSFSVTQTDIENSKFPTYFISESDLSSTLNNTASSFKVYVSGTPAIQVPYLYALSKDEYSYTLQRTNTGYKFIFGNGYIGKALKVGDYITIEANMTLGEDGNVPADSLTLSSTIYNEINKQPVNIYVKHSDITNGKNEEDIISIKNNIINKISTNDRIVTESDFANISKFVDFGTDDIYAIYSKSDLQKNEIDIYCALSKNGEYIKTNSISLKTANMTIKQGSLIYEEDNNNFVISETPPSSYKRIWISPVEIEIDGNLLYPKTYYCITNPYIPYKSVLETYYSLDNQSYIALNGISSTYMYKELVYDYILGNEYDAENISYDDITKSSILFRVDLFVNVNEINISYDENGFVDKSTIKNNFDFEIVFSSESDFKKITTDDIDYIIYDENTKILSVIVEFSDEDEEYIYPEYYQGSITVYYGYSGFTKERIFYSDYKPFRFKVDITEYSPVKIYPEYDETGALVITYYNIPVVYVDDYINKKDTVDELIHQYFSVADQLKDKLMLTMKANLAFPKTYGDIYNVIYTDTTKYTNCVEPNTVQLPLILNIDVIVSSTADTSYLKDKILYSLNTVFNEKYKGFQKTLILNKLEHDLYQELSNDNITKIEIKLKNTETGELIDKDIVFGYDFNTLQLESSEDLFKFTPEFMYIDMDNVDINFILE